MKGIHYNYIENNNTNIKTELIIAGSMIAVTLVSAAVLSSVRVNADTDTVDEVSITVPSACTMSGNIATGNEHTASITPNTYQNNIGKTTITAFCNDAGGYAIYAIGYTGDKYDGEGHTKLIGTNTNQKIATGTAKTGTSQWAMRITPVTGTYAPTIENNYDSEDYHIVPDTYEKVATYGNTTDATGGTGSSIETTYAAYISGTQAADTYTGKVKYTLVHPSTAPAPTTPQSTESGKIRYYANVSDYEGTMADQDIAAEVTLLPSNFSRTGYGFAGWSDKFDYATNPEAKFYGPMETITLNTADYTGTNPGLSLYAVWVKSQGNLQDSAKVTSVCSSLTTAPIDGTANLSSVSALTDQRDNNTYAIAKLADGKCWMIENMRLDNTNSDNSTGALAQGYATNATYGNFTGLANPETSWENYITTANSLYSTDGADDTINIGTSNASYRFPRYNNQNTSDRASVPATSANTYSYGNYYTWAAAIANLNDYDYYATNNASVTNTSICPTGWHLPTGGRTYASGNTSGVNVTGDPTTFREFYDLGYKTMSEVKTAYEDTPNGGNSYYSSNTTNSAGKTATAAFRSFPNNFLYSGDVYNGSVNDRGSDGYYWTSTTVSSSSAYSLGLNSSNVNPGTYYYNKYYGRTIRCLMGS